MNLKIKAQTTTFEAMTGSIREMKNFGRDS